MIHAFLNTTLDRGQLSGSGAGRFTLRQIGAVAHWK